MKTRNSAWYALGLAAAITLGSAFEASAQAAPRKPRPRARSQRQIPVRKEVAAPVATHDTVTITRVDTVTVRRVDTVSTTVMRYDTVTRMVYPPLQRLPGLFFGVGAGANIPMNNIRGYFKDSWAVQGQAGYFPGTSPLGLRVDGTFGKISHREKDCRNCNDPSVWTLGGDVLLRFPLDRTSKLNPVIYAFGGGGWSHFGDITIPQQIVLIAPGQNINVSGGHGYWDVGPGVDFSLGGLHLYAEGRYMTIMTNGTNTHMFPVYGGIKLY
jgi:hypothetical protein